VKYFASIPNNPIGVKLGPTATGEEAVELCKKLNPEHIPGRLTFIIRMGADKVRKNLPQLLRAVQAYEERIGRGPLVAWLCDPMHGNTFETLDGLKTRRLDVIIDEILGFFEVHRMVGTIPGGLSLEFTGENVTECVGGSHGLGVGDLAGGGYKSKCDPRLNNTQMLDLAYLLAEMLSDVR
jgi:3-deoxy-7-phosphoheptulonate synthase